jgi:predicted outer membrane repeat protein
LQEVASCGFASITGSTFNANTAAGAGGALSSDGSTLPVALSCGATSPADLPTYADAAAQQRNFTTPSFPSGADMLHTLPHCLLASAQHQNHQSMALCLATADCQNRVYGRGHRCAAMLEARSLVPFLQ